MTFPARWTSVAAGSGNFNTLVAGSRVVSTAIPMAGVALGTLSCLFALLAETNTITLTPGFQVSNDGTTWFDLAGGSSNPAQVLQATGTAGADTVVNKVVGVPEPALGWKFVRAYAQNGVVTGAAGDTYAFTFQFRKFSGFN